MVGLTCNLQPHYEGMHDEDKITRTPEHCGLSLTQKLIPPSMIVLNNGSTAAGSAPGLWAIQRPSSLHLGFSVIFGALFSSARSKLDLCHICISAVYMEMKERGKDMPIS